MGALLSLNLGILNLLPIPVLDGGHLFFFVLEMIFRRPVSLVVRERAATGGPDLPDSFYGVRLLQRPGPEFLPDLIPPPGFKPRKAARRATPRLDDVMLILALDTSTPAASAALVDDAGVRSESNLRPGETHSRTLLPEIDRLLKMEGLTAADMDLVAAGVGPGSFTGLRIGLAAAKGLAWAAGKPLVGVSSLDALAAGLPAEGEQACSVIDARKNQVYCRFVHPDGPGLVPTDRTRGLRSGRPGPGYRPAHGFYRGRAGSFGAGELADRLGANFVRGPVTADRPRAAAAAGVARRLWAAGAQSDPARVVPLYIRPPDLCLPKPGG